MHTRAEWLIKKLDLHPHPEGGYYREVYRSRLSVYSSQVKAERNAMTQIYFLLSGDQISRLHRVAHDELWIYLEGDALVLHTITIDLITYHTSRLGRFPITLTPSHPLSQSHSQSNSDPNDTTVLAPANTWQAGECDGEYTLVSCVVAPGFDFQDFKMLYSYPEEKEKMLKFWPELVRFI
jgi:predicted cupin superfamily sugar epimerase